MFGLVRSRKLRWLLAGLAGAGSAAFAQTSGGGPDDATALANTLQWQLRIAKATPGPDDTVFIIIHSAKDCPYCTAWKRQPGGLDVAKKIVDARQNVRVFIVERASISGEEHRGMYPDELVSEYDRRATDRELAPPVPEFEVFLRDKLVYRADGIGMWSKRVVPAVLNLEQRRDDAIKATASAPPGTAPSPSAGAPSPH